MTATFVGLLEGRCQLHRASPGIPGKGCFSDACWLKVGPSHRDMGSAFRDLTGLHVMCVSMRACRLMIVPNHQDSGSIIMNLA